MLNTIIEFKNSIISKFGPFLGWAILILGGLVTISILAFLIRAFFGIVIGLVIAGLVIFGVYKLSEMIKNNKKQ